jgi:hypothetical protein
VRIGLIDTSRINRSMREAWARKQGRGLKYHHFLSDRSTRIEIDSRVISNQRSVEMIL